MRCKACQGVPLSGQYYPLLLDLARASCLIIGFGEVGRRKAAMLLPARPKRICILDPAPADSEGEELLCQGQKLGIDISLSHEPFQEGMLEGMMLVFACASDHALNLRIAGLCQARSLLCNCTDDPKAGNFHVPAVVRKDPLTAALSTGRTSPALARRWKKELEGFLAPKAAAARLMGRIRPLVLAMGAPSAQNRELFRSLAEPGLEKALAAGDMEYAGTFLHQTLPDSLQDKIPELLSGLNQPTNRDGTP